MLGTKGREGRLPPAPSSAQSLCLLVGLLCKEPHTRADVTKMLHYDRQKSVSCELKQVPPLTPSIIKCFLAVCLKVQHQLRATQGLTKS